MFIVTSLRKSPSRLNLSTSARILSKSDSDNWLTLIEYFKFNEYNFQVTDMSKMLNTIIDNALNGNYIDYPVAEQASMAIGSIIKGMSDLGAIDKNKIKIVNDSLEKIYTAVDDPEKFEPKSFIASLKNFRNSVN